MYSPLSNPLFHDRETYLAWTADWKRRYAELSVKIRTYKLHRRINQRLRGLTEKQVKKATAELSPQFAQVWNAEYPPNYWEGSWKWSATAREMLVERHQSKITAQQQWEAAQVLKAAA